MADELRSQRVELLLEVERIQQKCIGCQIHYAFNKAKDVTGLTNACKACPVGHEIAQYGDKLMQLTRKRKKAK